MNGCSATAFTESGRVQQHTATVLTPALLHCRGGRTRDPGGGRLGSERQPRSLVASLLIVARLLIDSPQYQHSRPSIMHPRVVRSTGTPAGSAASALLGRRCAHASLMCMHGIIPCCKRVCMDATHSEGFLPQSGARRPAEPAPASTAWRQSASATRVLRLPLHLQQRRAPRRTCV